jgi:predicted secreted protein
VKAGQTFAISLHRSVAPSFSWDLSYDDTLVSKIDSVFVADPGNQNSGNTWFLFKALKSGQASISFGVNYVQNNASTSPPDVLSVTITPGAPAPTGTGSTSTYQPTDEENAPVAGD